MIKLNKKVFVIGSVSYMDSIMKAVEHYKNLGYDVSHVLPQKDKSVDYLIQQAFRHIEEADVVVAVLKEDGDVGTGTMYELTFAKHLKKEIHYYK